MRRCPYDLYAEAYDAAMRAAPGPEAGEAGAGRAGAGHGLHDLLERTEPSGHRFVHMAWSDAALGFPKRAWIHLCRLRIAPCGDGCNGP